MYLEQLKYRRLTSFSIEIVDFLESTVYGSDRFSYKHTEVSKRLLDLVNPDFHTLWKDEKLIAIAAYCKRKVNVNERFFDAYYIRYFSVLPELQNKGVGKYLTQKIEAYYKKEIVLPTLFYAYIENENSKSLGVSSAFKQTTLGEFKTVLFSRLIPKRRVELERVLKRDVEEFIKDRNLYHTQKIGYENNLFALRSNGEIVCAVQANKVEWSVVSLPGVMGWVSKNIFHFLPVIGKLCPRNKLKFIAFEGLYVNCDPEQLAQFLESILFELDCNIGMYYMDIKDPAKFLFKEMNLGLMDKIQSPPEAQFLAQNLHCAKDDMDCLRQNVKYISCFDLT